MMDESIGTTDTLSAPAETTATDSGSDKLSASMEAAYDAAMSRGEQQTDDHTENSYAPPTKSSAPTDDIPIPRMLAGRAGQDVWDAAPRELKELILAREDEATRKIDEQGRELGELRKAGGPSAELASVVERFNEVIPRDQTGHPMPAHSVLEHLLTAHHALESNPVQAIAWLANSYGIDLGQHAHDPQAAAQRDQQIWQQASQHFAGQQQQMDQARVNALTSMIERYRDGKEYWGELEGAILSQIEAINRADPWRAAVDPGGVLKEAEAAALKLTGIETKDARYERIRKADQAKRLASLNVRSSSAGRSPRSVPADIYADLGEIYDRHQAGG